MSIITLGNSVLLMPILQRRKQKLRASWKVVELLS